jgi:hypothetical protein
MEAIIQTLTLATILLTIGLACTVIGIAGLIWKTERDKRRIEKTDKAVTSGEITDGVLHQPNTGERSLNP